MVRSLADILAGGTLAGPDEIIDLGVTRDPAGHYRRAVATLRQIACLMLDELAARGVPIPPPPPEPEPPPPPEPPVIGPVPEVELGSSPLVARVLDQRRRQTWRDPSAEHWEE
jgi:hypothetical protein